MSNPYAEHFHGLKVTPSARTAAQWARVAPQERLGRMFSARVMDERLLNELKGLIDEALSEGMSQQDFVMFARRRLAAMRSAAGIPYNGAEDRSAWSEEERERYENDVRNVDSVARLRLMLRTQSRMASGVREFYEAFDEFWLEQFPGWRFVRQPGAQEKYKRRDHVEHENEVRLKSDVDFWLARNDPSFGGFNNPYPPFGYNSWCWVEPVSRQECEALGLIKEGEQVPVPDRLEEWGLPAAVQQLATAGVQGLSDDAVERLVRRCEGDGVPLERVAREDGGTELRVRMPVEFRRSDGQGSGSDLDMEDGLFDDWDEVDGSRASGLPPAVGVLWRALAMRRFPRRSSYGSECDFCRAEADWRCAWGV